MMTKYRLCFLASLLTAALLAALDSPGSRARSSDWPQWRGVHRDAISAETGLLKEWPKAGPPLAWKATGLGAGYSEVSVAGGRIFTMGERGDPQKPGSPEATFVIALDEATGKELWATRIGARYGDGGPRSTPTVDGDRVYALSPHGDLLCMDVATGKEHWRKNLPKDFGGNVGGWHYSESVLIDGDRLICTPGGKAATLVALDKKTGEVVWKAPVPGRGERAEYSSVVIANVDGQKQYIQFLQHGVVGIKADDGTFLWRYDHPANGTANCSTPVYHDGCVFAASAYGQGGGLARLTRDGEQTTAREAYFVKGMQNHHGGMVLVDGYLYGEGGGQLYCIDFKSGAVKWHEGRPGKGSIAYAEGRLYYRNEGGPITLVEANPNKYVEHGRFDPPQGGSGPSWPHPVIANGKLYIRHAELLFCYDVKEH
jgi:outer membrane protein assembly factor BamB